MEEVKSLKMSTKNGEEKLQSFAAKINELSDRLEDVVDEDDQLRRKV